jgi:hypothetical protein
MKKAFNGCYPTQLCGDCRLDKASECDGITKLFTASVT